MKETNHLRLIRDIDVTLTNGKRDAEGTHMKRGLIGGVNRDAGPDPAAVQADEAIHQGLTLARPVGEWDLIIASLSNI